MPLICSFAYLDEACQLYQGKSKVGMLLAVRFVRQSDLDDSLHAYMYIWTGAARSGAVTTVVYLAYLALATAKQRQRRTCAVVCRNYEQH